MIYPTWKDIIDIFLMAFILFQIYKLMKKSGAVNIFVGIVTFVVCWFLIVKVFNLKLTGALLNQLVSVGAFALVVIFQNEIRRFFRQLGTKSNWKILTEFSNLFNKSKDIEPNSFPTMELVIACRNMSRSKTGALIVIKRSTALDDFIDKPDVFTADINARLVENIFFKNSPLHDGAMIIADGKIVAASAQLPMSHKPDIPRHLGMRHRAALGISECSDAVVIIISEETGTISLAIDGNYKLNLTPEDLERQLTELIK
ncbi:MAG: diadenylate cyclase CdaA [Bacteroidales bacterium]|nr:diadenylate cyclase CdaA [Bacteroidales bacterium]MDY5194056.1 diadenylate cyclase CdaA [Candidatus Aphodosoma sp.]